MPNFRLLILKIDKAMNTEISTSILGATSIQNTADSLSTLLELICDLDLEVVSQMGQ